LNTYLYIMKLIFIKISGKLVCDYDTLHNHINAVELSWNFVLNFLFRSYRKRFASMFLTVNSSIASF
jgi:hypothetical protein